MIPVSEILDAAADLIDRHGWRRGSYGNDETGYCMVGAMSKAWPDDWIDVDCSRDWHQLYHAVSETLDKETGDFDGMGLGIMTWNDVHCRDGAQATTVLRKAAKLARLQEEEGDVT